MSKQSPGVVWETADTMLKHGAISQSEHRALKYIASSNDWAEATFNEESQVSDLCGSQLIDVLIKRIEVSNCLEFASNKAKIKLAFLLLEDCV
jgi:hypothetical protein